MNSEKQSLGKLHPKRPTKDDPGGMSMGKGESDWKDKVPVELFFSRSFSKFQAVKVY